MTDALRQVVLQPLRALGNALNKVRFDARLLLELAKRGRPRLLAVVDPALRHLPRVVFIIDAKAHEHLALAVEEHDADPAAISIVPFGHALSNASRRKVAKGDLEA